MNRIPTPAPISALSVWPGYNPDRPLELNPHHLPSGTSYVLPARESCARIFGLNWKVKIFDHHIEVAKELPGGEEAYCILQHKNISSIVMQAVLREDGEGVDVGIFARNDSLDLEVPLYLAPYHEDVSYIWQAWGKKTGAPLSMRMPDGVMRSSHSRFGAVLISTPRPRRNRTKGKRRSSIMASRKTGDLSRLEIVH